jgi:hypothetical protein
VIHYFYKKSVIIYIVNTLNNMTDWRTYRHKLVYSVMIALLGGLFISGCSKWNLEPKEITPTTSPTLPTVTITNVDNFSITGRGTVVTFTFNVTSVPRVTVKELGVCYSTTNKTPSLADASGTTALAKSKDLTLPSSIGVTLTAKGTYFYRAYALLDDGRVSYSKLDSIVI